jgi:hypothetical protein
VRKRARKQLKSRLYRCRPSLISCVGFGADRGRAYNSARVFVFCFFVMTEKEEKKGRKGKKKRVVIGHATAKNKAKQNVTMFQRKQALNFDLRPLHLVSATDSKCHTTTDTHKNKQTNKEDKYQK